ncbi:hypothetical protein D9M71_491630 [compost metagenome]
MDGVVSGDVTGMQGDHHLDGLRHHAAYVTTLELQARMVEACGRGVAQVDHVLAQLHTGYLCCAAQAVAQVIVHGKGQVALARAEVSHPQRLLHRHRGAGQGVVEHLDEFVDLLPLARHGRDQRALCVGHTEVAQKRPRQLQITLLLAVMPAARIGHARCLGTVALEHRFALLAEGQLHFAVGVEQMSIAEAVRQQFGNQHLGLVQRQVAGDVAGLVAVDQRQARLALDLQRLGNDPLQGLVGTDMARQHQFDQGIAMQGGVQQVEKLGARIRRGWGRRTGGHGKTVPRVAGSAWRNARILQGAQLPVGAGLP